MKETEIQRLRRKIIQGLADSTGKMLEEKVRTRTSIAIMRNDRVEVLSPARIKKLR